MDSPTFLMLQRSKIFIEIAILRDEKAPEERHIIYKEKKLSKQTALSKILNQNYFKPLIQKDYQCSASVQ